MTYLGFHLIFIVGPVCVLAALALLRRERLGRRTPAALFGVAPLALLYTARWDQELIARRVWWYGEDRVLGSWLGVPWEEYAFMLLQPVLTGALLLVLVGLGECVPAASSRPVPPTERGAVGAPIVLIGLAGGSAALQAGGRWTYAGLILLWALPVLGVLAAASWGGLRRFGRESASTWALATAYLCAADRVAIDAGVWTISPTLSTGWTVIGLPVEEALFFAVTNGLVVAGAMLFLTPGLPRPPEASSAGDAPTRSGTAPAGG